MSEKLNFKRQKGFTLIELLIVIAIISVIAAVAFVALDPLTRFRDSRDARRWGDVSALLSAIKVDQVDNRGSYLTAIQNLGANEGFMITKGAGSNCDVGCTALATSTDHCVDLAGLANEGYIADVPVSPNGAGTWTATHTGYVLTKTGTGAIKIQACEAENTTNILVAR